MMCPRTQDSSEAGSSKVSSNREANIHGFTKDQDLTMSCTHSGTGNYTHTHTLLCSHSSRPYTHDINYTCILCSYFSLLRLTSLTRLPSALVELSEPLQVIRYEHGDFSNAHHDSSASHSETICAHTRLAGNTSALTEVSCRYVRLLFSLCSVTLMVY